MNTIIHDAKRFMALSQPIRLVILRLIVQHEGSLNVAGLLNALPREYAIEQSGVSHHLRILREAGFVEHTRTGNEHYYYLRSESLVYCMDSLSLLARGERAQVAS